MPNNNLASLDRLIRIQSIEKAVTRSWDLAVEAAQVNKTGWSTEDHRVFTRVFIDAVQDIKVHALS